MVHHFYEGVGPCLKKISRQFAKLIFVRHVCAGFFGIVCLKFLSIEFIISDLSCSRYLLFEL